MLTPEYNLDSDYNVKTFVFTSYVFLVHTGYRVNLQKLYNIYYLFSGTVINLLFNNLLRLYYNKCTNSTFKTIYYDLIIISYNYSMNPCAILKVSHKKKRHANERLYLNTTSLPSELTLGDYAYTLYVMALLNIFFITLLCITNHALLFTRLMYYKIKTLNYTLNFNDSFHMLVFYCKICIIKCIVINNLTIHSCFLYVTFPSNNDSETGMAINRSRSITFSNYTYNAYSYSIYNAHLIYYAIQVFIPLGTVCLIMIYRGGGNTWYGVVCTNDELRKYSKNALLILVYFLKHILFEYSQIHFPKLRYLFLSPYISIKCFECSHLIYCQGLNIRTFIRMMYLIHFISIIICTCNVPRLICTCIVYMTCIMNCVYIVTMTPHSGRERWRWLLSSLKQCIVFHMIYEKQIYIPVNIDLYFKYLMSQRHKYNMLSISGMVVSMIFSEDIVVCIISMAHIVICKIIIAPFVILIIFNACMIHIDGIVDIIMTRPVIFHNDLACTSLLQYTPRRTQTSTGINTYDLYVYEWADLGGGRDFFYPNFIPYDYG